MNTENDSSGQTMIDELKAYCEARVLTLKKDMKKWENDKQFLSYLIGQEIAHKEIIWTINNSSSTTKTEGEE